MQYTIIQYNNQHYKNDICLPTLHQSTLPSSLHFWQVLKLLTLLLICGQIIRALSFQPSGALILWLLVALPRKKTPSVATMSTTAFCFSEPHYYPSIGVQGHTLLIYLIISQSFLIESKLLLENFLNVTSKHQFIFQNIKNYAKTK